MRRNKLSDIMSNNNVIFGKITSVSAQKSKKDGKPLFMLDVFSPIDGACTKAFLSPKVVAHALTGDSANVVDAAALQGKYVSAQYLSVGDMLADGTTEVDKDNTIINNSTVSFLSKSDAIELVTMMKL